MRLLAVGAFAVEDDLVPGDRVADLAFDGVKGAFEPGVAE